MRALLDVNFLVALAWRHHQFHTVAQEWLEEHEALGWATCTTTQLGFVRLSCQTSIFGDQAKTPQEAAQLLLECTSRRHHVFFSELPKVTDCHELSKIMGPNKVTDAYLVSVARFHRSRLVTFDRRMGSLSSTKNLIEVVLPAVGGK